MKFQAYKENLIERLEKYFSFFENNQYKDIQYDIAAFFATQQNQTVLFKENVMDFICSKEFLLLTYAENLSISDLKLEQLGRLALDSAEPSRHHKSTILTRVYVTDNCSKEVIKSVKKFHFSKSFRCFFWGWTEVRTILITLADNKVYSNAAGRTQRKFFTFK